MSERAMTAQTNQTKPGVGPTWEKVFRAADLAFNIHFDEDDVVRGGERPPLTPDCPSAVIL
jgi:hypothetical protein